MVGFDTPRSRLASPTVVAPPLSRSTISRRIGCARAANGSLAISLTIVVSRQRNDTGGVRCPSTRSARAKEWEVARDELLTKEKELMRRNDELAQERRELPWMPVEKEYVFETADGRRQPTQAPGPSPGGLGPP
jgi:hypothetical protein